MAFFAEDWEAAVNAKPEMKVMNNMQFPRELRIRNVPLNNQDWRTTIPAKERRKGNRPRKNSRAERAMLPPPAIRETYWSFRMDND